jgi:hypothetical protein
MDLIISVQVPMNRLMTNPPRTVLISGMPLCRAYGAYFVTRVLAEAAKTTCAH